MTESIVSIAVQVHFGNSSGKIIIRTLVPDAKLRTETVLQALPFDMAANVFGEALDTRDALEGTVDGHDGFFFIMTKHITHWQVEATYREVGGKH